MEPINWHTRFIQQAQWTQAIRAYLFEAADYIHAKRVLAVGCGTGAVLMDLPDGNALQFGLDIDQVNLDLAMRNCAVAKFSLGDAHTLPYPDNCFDITFCHFLLLWVDDPQGVIREMERVTRPGGFVLALAEPDYGGRVDFPEDLAPLGKWQTAALRYQGADPHMGRKLAGIFHRAGLESIETGALGGQWSGPPDWDAWESEWAVLESDLKEKLLQDLKSFRSLKALDQLAYKNGERVLYVPTFYAWGKAIS